MMMKPTTASAHAPHHETTPLERLDPANTAPAESFVCQERPRVDINRDKEGLCMNCGKRLYSVKTKSGLFRKRDKEVKVPLSIPGQVERGQCLQCGLSTICEALSETDEDLGTEGTPVNGSLGVKDEHKTIYEGDFNLYGERDGEGTMTWSNGDVYKGAFFNGNRHGQGTLLFANGSEYVGDWECNLQHGVGTRRWNNGDCYTGQFQNGKRTGEGRFYFSNGDMYIGMWLDGVTNGPGRYYYASGQRFEGTFVNGKRKGKGKLQRTDGSLDVGVYNNDVRTGLGVRWSADRTKAWRMYDGVVKKKITVPEAVALDYDIDKAVEALDEDGVV